MRQRLLRLTLAAAATVAALLAAEGICWLLGVSPQECRPYPPAPIRVVEPFHYRLPAGYRGDLECPRSGWNRPGFSVPLETNALGFRDREPPVEKRSDTTRIVVLGDSVAMGFAVPFAASFPSRLEARLEAATPGRDFEVISLAVWAMNTEMEVNAYLSAGRGLVPDLVLLVSFPNDAELEPGQEVDEGARGQDDESSTPGTLEWLASGIVNRGRESSRLFRTAHSVWRWKIQRRPRLNWKDHGGRLIVDYEPLYADGTPGWASVERGLATLAEVCGSDETAAGVVLFPMLIDLSGDYPYAAIHARVSAAASRLSLPVLDLVPAFAGYEGRELWVTGTDSHPDAQGHDLAAAHLADWVRGTFLDGDGAVRRRPSRADSVPDS
jgi:hypothetical protein